MDLPLVGSSNLHCQVAVDQEVNPGQVDWMERLEIVVGKQYLTT